MYNRQKALFHYFFAVILGVLPGINLSASLKADGVEKPLEVLEAFREKLPQQKVFLHTDKENYLAGEDIWIKAYVVDAATHLPDTLSSNLQVELLNYRGELVERMLLRLDNGRAHGEFTLADSLSDGNYVLRAHTHWMKNFGEDFFFDRHLYVNNPEEANFIRFGDRRQNRRFNRELDARGGQMQFAVFPEGGQLASGLENRVAFKATNMLGAGLDVRGRLTDSQGNEITAFESLHLGMGVFSFTPLAGESYFAEVVFPGGEHSRIPLPEAKTGAYLLTVAQDEEFIHIGVKSNFDPVEHGLPQTVHLLAQVRGEPVFAGSPVLENNRLSVDLPLGELPAGIVHITLFGPNATPLAERLVFANQETVSAVSGAGISDTAERDGSGMVTVAFDKSGEEDTGSYSLAVVEGGGPDNPHASNILTWFYLENDLGQALEDPWYYFSEDFTERKEALDVMMMTHGWRRFEWESLLDGEFPEPGYPVMDGLSIRGQVVPLGSSYMPGQLTVELAVIRNEEYSHYSTETNFDGEFVFEGLDVEGYFLAEMTTRGDLTDRRFRIDMIARKYDRFDYEYIMDFHTQAHSVLSRGSDWERVRRPLTLLSDYPDDIEERDRSGTIGTPDFVLYLDDVRMEYPDLASLLPGRIPGLRTDQGSFYFHGPSSINLDTEPLFLVEGVIVTRASFFSLNPKDVEKIEAYRGPSAAIFGRSGANGALNAVIRTGRGETYYEFQLLGYNSPRTFFQSELPAYRYEQSGVARTIFWEPMIKPGENGKRQLEFELPAEDVLYYILLQGMDAEGGFTYQLRIL